MAEGESKARTPRASRTSSGDTVPRQLKVPKDIDARLMAMAEERVIGWNRLAVRAIEKYLDELDKLSDLP